MSQEKKDDKPGQKRSSAPKVSASCSDVSPALHHLTLALPTGLSGLCGTGWHISPTQGGPGCTAHSTEQSLQAQSTDGGVHHCVTAQCQQNKVSLFHVLLEYLNSIILLIIYKLQVLPLGFFGIFVCCSESDGILLFFLLLFSLVSYGVFGAFDFFFCLWWDFCFGLGLLFFSFWGGLCGFVGFFFCGFLVRFACGFFVLFLGFVLFWFWLHCKASYRLLLLFYFGGIFCPQVAAGLSSRSTENVALWRVHRPWTLKKCLFVRAWVFLLPLLRFTVLGRQCHSKQKPERSQSSSARVEDTRYLEIDSWTSCFGRLIPRHTRKRDFNFWKGLFSPGSYWILSLMQLKRHVPCSVVRNSRPRARGLVHKHRAQGVWRGVWLHWVPEAQSQPRLHF